MRKLNSSEQKALLSASIMVVVFVLLWIFIYIPRYSHLSHLKFEFKETEHRIQQIEKVFSAQKDISEGIAQLKKQSQQINAKFPSKEEESLKMFSDFARKMNIEVTSVESQHKIPFLNQNQQKVQIDGQTCQSVFVSIDMKGSYKDFVRYLEVLKSALPAYVNFEKVQIRKNAEAATSGAQILNIRLELNLFLLS